MSDQACEILLHQTKYDVKPVLCVSDTSYGSNSENHHYGLGQGYRCAGTTWLFECAQMMETVEKNAKVSISYPLNILYHTQSIL